MSAIELLELLTKQAKEYREGANASLQRNHHMNEVEYGEVLQQRHIDAILTDFINRIGTAHGIDYALYTIDLREKALTNQ